MTLDRRGAFATTLILAMVLGASAASAKRGIVVTDFDAEPALQPQAAALTLLVRSHLTSTNRPSVFRGVLRAALGTAGGAKERLVVDTGQIAKVLARVGADRLVRGKVEQDGPGLRVHLTVLDEGGIELGTGVVKGNRGDIGKLATGVTRKAAELAGELVATRRPRISIGQLRAFAAAGRALNVGDHKRAFRALSAARRGVGGRVAAAREIADTLLLDHTLPFERRTLAAIASGNTIAIAKQVAAERSRDKRSELARAAAAFLALERADTKSAGKQLRPLRRSKHKFVMLVRADFEHRTRDKRARNRILDDLLTGTPYVPALAFIADLPPGDLGVPLEHKALEAAVAVQREFPGLAAALGARAARGGVKIAVALGLIDARELDGTELASLKPLLEKLAKERKAVAYRLLAEVQLRDGDLDEARKNVARGLALDRDDEALKNHRARLKSLDEPDDDPELVKNRTAANKKLTTNNPIKSSTLEALVNHLTDLLGSFPALSGGNVRNIAIVSLPGNKELFFWPRQVNPHQLRSGLVLALKGRPYELNVTEATGTVKASSKADYERVAGRHNAHAVLAYGIRTKGSQAAVQLILFDKNTGEAKEYREDLKGAEFGLVSWNHAFIAFVGSVVLLLLVFIFWKLFRPTGTVVVNLALDGDADEPALAIQLSKSPRRPDLGNLQEFNDKLRGSGAEQSLLYSGMVGKTTRFEKVPTGRWWVHIYGTFTKSGELMPLPDSHSLQAKIKRNKPIHVKFDLVPATTEYRLRVYDGDKPVRDAEVWLDDDRASSARTSNAGELVLDLPRGEHVIRIVASGMRVERRVDVADAKIHNLTINLARERKLARVKDGIELDPHDAREAEIIDASGRSIAAAPAPAARGAGGESIAPAVSFGAKGSSPPAGATAPLVSFGPNAGKDAATAQTMATPLAAGSEVAPSLPGSGTAQYSGAAPTGLRRYQPVQELGRGAMGVVYRAVDTVLERDVALKVMSEAVRQYPMALKMFLQEAKALAALNHPNIVTVFDQGHDNGQPFMVMEWVEGTTLEDLLEREKTLDLERAVDLADQMCAGLAYAHGRRIIHRDIKPANIFLTPDGVVKIGDFGLARVMHELKIKQTEIKGTPLYMSPEQIYGKDMDFRSDLYSVGCTLFEAVAGRPPFVDGEILFHHVNTPPPKVSMFRPDAPAALETLIMRCIAKDKEQRVRSADAMRKALKSIRAMMN